MIVELNQTGRSVRNLGKEYSISEATKVVENIDKNFFGKLNSEHNSFLELLKRLS